MSFSPDWLALRRDADDRARCPELARRLSTRFSGPTRVLDLGSGTGANMIATAPLLGDDQSWVLADNDATLLDRAVAPEGVHLSRRVVDLAVDLESLFNPAPDLVTASAFFDLCGSGLIGRVVAATVAAGASFYTVLTYDGRERWLPPHPLDTAALQAFHADQQRDKGLGPALGPDASPTLERAFAKAGYHVETGTSDWTLEAPGDSRLIAALAEGSAAAISPPLTQTQAEEWRNARRRATSVMIGHRDVLAVPTI